jgi:hypothetical protein
MKPIGMRTVNHFDVALKVREIGRKDTGCNAVAHRVNLTAKVVHTLLPWKHPCMKFLIAALFTIPI